MFFVIEMIFLNTLVLLDKKNIINELSKKENNIIKDKLQKLILKTSILHHDRNSSVPFHCCRFHS